MPTAHLPVLADLTQQWHLNTVMGVTVPLIVHLACCAVLLRAFWLYTACKRAWRHVQQAAITAEVEAAAAAVEAELDAQEWNMQEIERIQEEQACTAINTAQPPMPAE